MISSRCFFRKPLAACCVELHAEILRPYQRNDHLIRDEDGVDKPTVEDVRAEARSAARELWTDAIQTGADLDVEAFVIADENGREVITVPVEEVLPKRIRAKH